MKNVLLHASKNEIVDILDVTSEKCALSISCQMFQLENGSALLVDSKINNFSNTSRQRIGRSCQCPPNLTSLQRNKIWWHNWACFLGCKNYSYMMTLVLIHVCTFSWLSGLYSALKMLLSLMIRPLFSQGFIFSWWWLFSLGLQLKAPLVFGIYWHMASTFNPLGSLSSTEPYLHKSKK